MYWLWEGECPITVVYSFYKARQIDIEGCPLLPADLALRPTITMNMLTLWEASVISLSGTISLVDLFCYLNVLPW